MTLTEAKKFIKSNGLYEAISALRKDDYDETGNLQEVIYRVLDEIDSAVLQKAINKGAK